MSKTVKSVVETAKDIAQDVASEVKEKLPIVVERMGEAMNGIMNGVMMGTGAILIVGGFAEVVVGVLGAVASGGLSALRPSEIAIGSGVVSIALGYQLFSKGYNNTLDNIDAATGTPPDEQRRLWEFPETGPTPFDYLSPGLK